MRIVIALAALFTVALCAAPEAQAQRKPTCMQGLTLCPAGPYGPGGCYRTASYNCYQGALCLSNLTFCKPGRYGPGACYNAAHYDCIDGATCMKPLEFCAPGRKGSGKLCYNPRNYYCDDGRLMNRR